MEAINITDEFNDTDFDEITAQVEAIICEEEKIFGEIASPVAASSIISKDIIYALENNEVGDSCLFLNLQKYQYCYDHSGNQWFRWNGHYWRQDFIGDVYTAMDLVVDQYSKEAQRQAIARINAAKKQNQDAERKAAFLEKELLKRIRDLQTLYRQKNVLTLSTKGEDSLGISGDEWDRHPFLLPCKNGVINLLAGEVEDGRPEDYIKIYAPVEWKGFDEKAPRWEKFLLEIFKGDVELVKYVQRLLGYGITGSTRDNIIVIFWGPHGRNGKTTIFETLLHILGQFIGPIQSEMLTVDLSKKSADAPSPAVLSLRGKRLVWASESEEGSNFAVSKLKWLSGSDSLTGRQPHGKDSIVFPATHKTILITNHKPKQSAADQAMWQRIHLVPFELSFVDNPEKKYERQRDPGLPEKLKSEASGILAWLVAGCLEWQRIGLSPPKVVVDATALYKEEEDIVGLFLEDCTDKVLNGKVRARVLYKAFKNWCECYGHRYLSENMFGRKMTEHYNRNGDRKSNCYEGLSLKPDPRPDSDDGQDVSNITPQNDGNLAGTSDGWGSYSEF